MIAVYPRRKLIIIMLDSKVLIVVLLVVTQLQPLNAVDLLPDLRTIDYLLPDSVKDKAESMLEPVDTEWLQQAIANYTEPPYPTVRFFLYCNPSDPQQAHELHTDDIKDGLSNSCFVRNACVKFLIHGYLFPYNTPCAFPQSTKEAYLAAAGNCPNIFLVDYSGTTGFLIYPLAVAVGLKEASNQVAAFIVELCRNNLTKPMQIHVVGVSLGAQVAGFSSALVKGSLGEPLGRLTGLDPAGPCFHPKACFAPHVISSSGALFVDIMHTNWGGLGIAKKVGHVDFYVNGGICQPWCIESPCCHVSSVFLFDRTITGGPSQASVCACPNNAVSLNQYRVCCETQVDFGEYMSDKRSGEFYVPIHNFVGPYVQAFENCLSSV